MKKFRGFSYCLMLAIIFFVIGAHRFAFADEKCQEDRNRLLEQTSEMPLTSDDILTTMMTPWMFQDYFRPWRILASLSRDLGSTIKTDKGKFQINLDVQYFSPGEISVKTHDGYIVIEVKHDEKEDEYGFISRQFVRRYALPDDVESENVVCELSSDGILTVSAPRKVIDEKGVRIVPITKTGPLRKELSEAKNDNQDTSSCSAPDKKFNV